MCIRDSRKGARGSDGTAGSGVGVARAARGASACSASGAPCGRAAGGSQSCDCLLYTSPSPRDRTRSRMPSSA